MSATLLRDDAETIARLDSVVCLLEWTRSLPPSTRTRFFAALAECSDAAQQVVVSQIGVIKNPHTAAAERQRALTTIGDTLSLRLDEVEERGASSMAHGCQQKAGTQEEAFAHRLRQLMEARRISQQEIADRIGCSQPAISQMLNRHCRPQKRTIVKLAEALNVHARDLWPDIEAVEMLDAVGSFQQDDYVMSDAEAHALRDTTRRNRPKIQPQSLPPRRG